VHNTGKNMLRGYKNVDIIIRVYAGRRMYNKEKRINE